MDTTDKNYFKAFIRVVKSIDTSSGYYGSENIIEERLIEANNKEEVKKFLVNKYPQFFPENKIYTRETKDVAQFFYVVIYELWEHEKKQLVGTQWECTYCKQKHGNTYVSRPRTSERLFGNKVLFCKSDDDYCLNQYKKEHYKGVDLPDNEHYIKRDSPIFIYKITEKSTGKCYIGKTKNAPFFRWWNHLTHSYSPFGLYLRNETKLNDWLFEVLNILPFETPESEVFRIESEYIKQFDSIKNGFNSLISNKDVLLDCEQEELKFE